MVILQIPLFATRFESDNFSTKSIKHWKTQYYSICLQFPAFQDNRGLEDWVPVTTLKPENY